MNYIVVEAKGADISKAENSDNTICKHSAVSYQLLVIKSLSWKKELVFKENEKLAMK
ncbi:hypothetical protein [Okeania sp. SIO2B3]|uniref:hypothetical protein n=1 Tax=Okeania sp. SIO2B3 TaxID=2607784 RepID=UPI0013C1A1E1|nr:hypothetical protein [Okeania sp. SIO2B3]NET40873.1 hypothetical protein [Okeania sp. SIO2B3]